MQGKTAQPTPQAQKKPAAPKTQTVHLHVYFPIEEGPRGYDEAKFFDFLHGKETSPYGINPWDLAGVNLVLHTKRETGVEDFKKSLSDPGAIVVYLGHSVLSKGQAIGLSPSGRSPPGLPTKTIMELLTKSTAALVILASCDSQSCVGKLKNGPVAIVTDSGPDKKTNSIPWSHAIASFLYRLIGYKFSEGSPPDQSNADNGTIQDALDVSAEAFDKAGTKDRFKLVNGDPSKKIFP
jgi:hypothetical protein